MIGFEEIEGEREKVELWW